MSAGFTPGPWWASVTREVFNSERRTVCRAHLDGNKCTREQALANAHLIAAAPDLYAALEQVTVAYYAMHVTMNADPNTSVALTKAHAALAKARGEA